jgi:hypothetical protein
VTTDSGLRAIRESIELAVAASETEAGEAIREQVDAAVEYYGLNYSKFGPALLFDEVRRTRVLVAGLLPAGRDRQAALDLQRAVGWLSALLGNLAFHLNDHPGARTHLAAATELSHDVGDAHLAAWTCGAQSMLARYENRHLDALERAKEGLTHAHTPLLRAQLRGWAQLPALAGLGRGAEADQTLDTAVRDLELASNVSAPGRFGFDPAELELHAAEAMLSLERSDEAMQHAMASAAHCPPDTPGWAAATLTAALGESRRGKYERAAGRALVVLDRIPPSNLRATSRRRLAALERSLSGIDMAEVRTLRERLRVLPSIVANAGPEGSAGSASA